MVCVGGNQLGFARRKPLNLPTKPASRQVTKVCLPLFLFDRRMQGDADMAGCDDSKAENFEDIAEIKSKR